MALTSMAQTRRPIDPQHPMWLIHVDAWNYADPQKIIDLIPADIKPYVCLNLSLSCSYDTTTGYHKKPENAVLTFKSWATVCCQNNVWFTLQHASGGQRHISDDDLDTFEYFFKHYKNFLGWNYAEQFWGFVDEANDYASTEEERLALFANLVPMSHKYGGLLIVSYCGNIYSHPLNPVAMMKRNADLLQACRQYPEAILWCYKYTTAACWYNNESVCLGPFVSGLANNYGVRYDNCGWDQGTETYEKWKANVTTDPRSGRTYPASVGIGPVLDQVVNNGACVFDGPELIWTQCFKEIDAAYDSEGYRYRNWETYTQFDNIWVDLFRKMIDGTIHIATRDEVIDRTNVVVVQDFAIANDDGQWQKWKAYATKDDMYDGLYKQDDPMNFDTGNKAQNCLLFKKTGRYQAIPVVNGLYDSKAQSIPVQVKQTDIVAGNVWATQTEKVNQFNAQYAQEYTGDLFASRNANEWVLYYPFSYYYSSEKTASASMSLKYNTCSTMEVTMQKFDAGVVKEFSDHLNIYLNNFRTDTTTIKTATIKISGATAKPTYSYTNRSANSTISGGLTLSESWSNSVYTLTVKHMGPVDITLNCAGSSTGKLTDYLSDNLLTPQQPETGYEGPVITEAEVFRTKNVSSIVKDAYAQQSSIHNHAGLGFVLMGTNSSAAINTTLTAPKTADYYVKFRYSAPNGGMTNYRICVDSESNEKGTVTFSNTGSYSTWQETSNTISLTEGSHKIYLKAVSAGNNLAIDQMTLVPTDYVEETIDPDGATFNYDTESGRYMADFSYFSEGGDLSFDSSTGVVTIPAGKSGTLTYSFSGADFSNVSRIKLDYSGDDLFSKLTVTSGGEVINNGNSFWSSKYLLNFTNYQEESDDVTTLVWTGSNSGSSDKTMTIKQLLVLVDVLRADQKHEIPITADMYATWDGVGADAALTGDAEVEFNTDVVLSSYGVIYGSTSVAALQYADLTKYSKLRIYGDNGIGVRALFNRVSDTGTFMEKSATITDNVFEINLSEVGDYAHLNSIKVSSNANKGMIWRVMLVDDDCIMDYYISGKAPRTTSLENALADTEATNFDATALTNVTNADLTTDNLNALVYVTDVTKVANESNVVLNNNGVYTAANIVLTDAATALTDRPAAYFPGGSVIDGDATWADAGNNDGSYAFEWQAGTQAAVQIFNYIIDRQDYSRLVIETESFTKPWGIRFIDNDGNTITEQKYYNAQNSGNLIKNVDIDSLFAAKSVSDKRSVLTKVRIFNVSSDAGQVVLKDAYLCNSMDERAFPFFAPYDIQATSAKLKTAVGSDGFNTLCVPFDVDVPSTFSAYTMTENDLTAVSSITANCPVVIEGDGGLELTASNTTVKATDELTDGILKATYKSVTSPVDSYVQQENAGTAVSFSPVEGLNFCQVTDGNEIVLYPFRAYATEAMESLPDYYDLTVTNALVATMYLPYAVTIPDEDFLEVCYVSEVDKVNETVRMKKFKGTVIPPNQGVILFGNQDTYRFYRTTTTETIDDNLLKGVVTTTSLTDLYDETDLDEGRVVVLTMKRGTGDEGFVNFTIKDKSESIAANKAYLPVWYDEGENIKAFKAEFEQLPTCIHHILDNVSDNKNDAVYDLAGRRVTKPKNGIYIVNGKKILIK